MKRFGSTLALLVVLVGLGSYIYFTGAKPADTTTKQDKVFPGLDATKIEELTVKSESGDVTTLKKSDSTWNIAAPIAVPAASNEANGVTNMLQDVEIVRVVDEAPADLKEYGLDAPRLTVDFKADGGKQSGRLLVGAKTATAGNLYAKRDDQKRVVLIGEFNQTAINKSTFDLRDKTIVKLERPNVQGLTLDVSGAHAEFKKTDNDWSMTKPMAARADTGAIEGLLARVETLQMKSVVTATPTPDDLKKYGFDKPQALVTFNLGKTTATLTLGAKADDTSTYLRDSSRPDVVTIDSSSADDLKKSGEDYRKKELFDMRAFNATHVELTRNGQTVVLDRVKSKEDGKPDTWHRASPNPGDPDREKVEQLLAGLADIRATSFVAAKGSTGLDAPTLAVVVKFEDGKKEERVAFAKKGDDVFASRPDDPGAAKVDASKYDDAVKLLDELSK